MKEKEWKAQTVLDIDAALRHRIKFVRAQQGITQAEVADHLGIVPQQYHKYETGLLRFSGGMIASIATALDCSISDLIPEQLRTDARLSASKRLDLLKQELTMMILDETSEDQLVAIKTLLKR